MNDREALRAKSIELLQRLRPSDLPQALFELLETLLIRLDRIELGEVDPHEAPTSPGTDARKNSSANMQAVKDSVQRVMKHLEKAKDANDDKKQKS